jgi:hypothetical protein
MTFGGWRPENVMMDTEGHVCVIQTGIAQHPLRGDWQSLADLICAALAGVPNLDGLAENARGLVASLSAGDGRIKTHRFFDGINWTAVTGRSMDLPERQSLDELYAEGQ